VVGLFIGPVIFAIGYQIFSLWIQEVREEEGGATESETADA